MLAGHSASGQHGEAAALADQLGRFFAERKQALNVLLELGPAGGRTGVRDEAQQQAVLAAIERRLRLPERW